MGQTKVKSVLNTENPNVKHWKPDIISGLIVFLIALPLSLGIALASNAPPTSGIIAAILGGIVGSLVTGSQLTINGPAAGLVVVVALAIQNLGGGDAMVGFRRMLACTVVAGVLQIITGALKGGKLANFFPNSVVHGMLSGIGMIIMLKQYPVFLGVKPLHTSMYGLMMDLPRNILGANGVIMVIGIVSLVVLMLWNKIPKPRTYGIPGALVAVIIGTIIGELVDLHGDHTVDFLMGDYVVGPNFLVHLPTKLQSFLIFPDFSVIFSMASITSIFTIYVVASIEALLSAFAIDKLDPFKRQSNLSLDLAGKGLVNVCCGLIGGLPVIAEIVRSSANVSNGARTKWANFSHGAIFLVFVVFFPDLLNEIPLTALAAILLTVGMRLFGPEQFLHMWREGKVEFVAFTITLVLTVFDDLLVGIVAGIASRFVLLLIMRCLSKKELSPTPVQESIPEKKKAQ